MAKPKKRMKPGRKALPENKLKQMVPAYLDSTEKEAINAAYGNISNALRQEVLPKVIKSTV